MSKPCILTERKGLPNFCEKHGMYHNGPNYDYSQRDDPLGIKMRGVWDGHIDPEGMPYIKARIPTLVMIWRYIKALIGHTWNGFGYAPWPVVWKRRRTCNACPKRDPKTDSCQSCGCSLHGTIIGDKLRWASSTCPEGKW